ncbi:MAG: phosphoribosylanthranilate isomerase, partial [Rhodothermales bacterium]
DYLGFIQYRESPRYIEPARVREIVDWIYGPDPVGVFVDETAADVNRIADEAGFTLVQLHGDEPVFEVARIDRPVIKAIRVAPDTTTDALRRQLRAYENVVDHFLLDTHSAALRGGTGEAFDWEVARGLSADYDLFLAGGVGADNVQQGVRLLDPFGVDVSSSLEVEPGIKDFTKIDTFMRAFDTLSSTSRTNS